MKLLWIVFFLSANLVAAPDIEATRRIFGRFSDADRLIVKRGALCHPQYVKSYVIAEVIGAKEVREVLSHLGIEKVEPKKFTDEETGEEIYSGGIVIIACPDYTLFFYHEKAELGTLGLLGASIVKAKGEKEDQLLTEESRKYLNERFGLVEEPQDTKNKDGKR